MVEWLILGASLIFAITSTDYQIENNPKTIIRKLVIQEENRNTIEKITTTPQVLKRR